jgi:hypothetical protein
MRPVVARALVGLGTVADPSSAGRRRRHLQTAITMLHDMGLDLWRTRAESALREIRGADVPA